MVTQTSLAEAAKTVKELPKTQQSTIKGGVLLVCEEKRHTNANSAFTTTNMAVEQDGTNSVDRMP